MLFSHYFLRDILERHLSLKGGDNEQSNLLKQRIQIKVKKQLKKSFLNNLGLLFSAREPVLNNFKSRLFLVKNLDKIPTREQTP